MVRYQCTHLFIEITDLYAGIAQLVERCLAKAKVAGSNPVSRSKFYLFCTITFHRKTLFNVAQKRYAKRCAS